MATCGCIGVSVYFWLCLEPDLAGLGKGRFWASSWRGLKIDVLDVDVIEVIHTCVNNTRVNNFYSVHQRYDDVDDDQPCRIHWKTREIPIQSTLTPLKPTRFWVSLSKGLFGRDLRFPIEIRPFWFPIKSQNRDWHLAGPGRPRSQKRPILDRKTLFLAVLAADKLI